MKKNSAAAWIILFIALFLLPSLIYPFFRRQLAGENRENRLLAEKPALTLDSWKTFPTEYEEYYNDSMPFRSHLIKLNNTLQYYLFRQQDINGVAIGRDGWLFYCSEEAGNPVNQSLGCWHFSEEELETMASEMQHTKDALEAQGIEFVLFIPPNKESIYMEKLPAYYERVDEYTATDQLVDYMKEHTDVKVVYPKNELLAFKKTHPDIQLYRKLDSHWNNAGAYIGTKALCAALEIELPELDALELTEMQLNTGDLATVMNAAVTNTDTDYQISGPVLPNAETVEENSDGKSVYQTAGADKRRLFVARDSYSIALAPFLASQFENSVFIHHNLFDSRQIEEYDANVYVLEIVERNEYQLPMYAVK